MSTPSSGLPDVSFTSPPIAFGPGSALITTSGSRVGFCASAPWLAMAPNPEATASERRILLDLEKSENLATVFDCHALGGRLRRQSGHGHDVTRARDDESGASRAPY